MQSKKLDLLSDKRKQSAQLLKMVAIYCRNHRLMDFNIRELPPSAIDAIGNEIVDLFVTRVQQLKKNTPPRTGAQTADSVVGKAQRTRLH
ncbi:hypothetical protein BXY66_2509 [Shimia isoporae]|uniref:Uncharacterized protein n=1 Tax=Shimia isoporae TaxID=647720 RepID=A0A4R1N3C7_9RHOB|nr:hypothetical protein BXY66_2509 [Shimia isoporae]